MLTALTFVAILVVLIVTHELGHFLVAKLFRVRVEEFGVGYPPRAFLLGKIAETEYTLNWIPFGGFVRLYGEDADAHGRGSFADAPRYVQALILLAGVAANALVAWILFASALHVGIPRVIEGAVSPLDTSAHLVVSNVFPGSPASAAGLSAGDVIVSMRDQNNVPLSVLTPASVSAYIKVRGGNRITLSYVRDAATSSVSLVPANSVIPNQAASPALGVGLVEVSSIALPWDQSLVQGFTDMHIALLEIGTNLSRKILEAFQGKGSISDLVGPVGLVGVVGEATQHGWGQVLALAGFIAVNLTIINLIPIPVLDGGRLVLVILEAIIRRPAPKLIVQVLNTLGVALIILLMLVVTYHDIARLLM
jgi:regulator of sigma E protease